MRVVPDFFKSKRQHLQFLQTMKADFFPGCGFSVDVEGPITFQEAARGFGQSVVQLLVGAPLQVGDVNETGKVYKCDPGSRRCQEIPIQSRGPLCCGIHLCSQYFC
uniref:Uncharacterized protein n=1 Tax=Chrysemys picta bellii TaxID=8478 RepID=A0A8C3FQC8_CHRPI